MLVTCGKVRYKSFLMQFIEKNILVLYLQNPFSNYEKKWAASGIKRYTFLYFLSQFFVLRMALVLPNYKTEPYRVIPGATRTRFTDNGFVLYLIPMPYRINYSVRLRIWTGYAYEGKRVGATEWLEHVFVFAPKISSGLVPLEGSVYGDVDRLYTDIHIVAAKSPEIAIKLLFGAIKHFESYLEIFERERASRRDEDKRVHDNPDELLEHAMFSAVFDGTKLGKSSLIFSTDSGYSRAVDIESMLKYKETWLVPNNMRIAVAGPIQNPRSIIDETACTFGKMKRHLIRRPSTSVSLTTPNTVKEVDRPFLRLSTAAAWRTYPHIISNSEVLAYLIGLKLLQGVLASDNGRLSSLRDVSYDPGAEYHEIGAFSIDFGTDPRNFRSARERKLEIVDEIRKKGITQEELKAAKSYVYSELNRILDDPEKMTEMVLNNQNPSSLLHDPSEFRRLIRNARRDPVVQAAQKFLDPQNYASAVVGPLEKINR